VVLEADRHVSFMGFDATVIDTLEGYRLERAWASPGMVVLSKRRTYYELRPAAGLLRRLPSEDAVQELVPANERLE